MTYENVRVPLSPERVGDASGWQGMVSIRLERREDGGLRVWSDDLPGLILSGKDAAAVMADVLPAIDTLMAHKNKGDAR